MPSLNEDAESSSSPEAKPGALQHIPTDDASSIDGPVAQRGERPLRGGKPGQDRNQNQNQGMKKEGGPSEEMMKQDGLKLRLELNLDIELELKASIRGDITLALL